MKKEVPTLIKCVTTGNPDQVSKRIEDFHVPEPVRHRHQDPPALGNRGIESYYRLQDDERNVTLSYDDQGPPGLKTF